MDMNSYSKLILQEFAEKLTLPNSSKIAVYTAITNDFDNLWDPEFVSADIDYICFTTNAKLKSSIWNVIDVPFRYRDPRRLARLFKVLPHLFLRHYTLSVWMDGNVIPIGDIHELLGELSIDEKFLCFRHPSFRNCIYGEGVRCIWTGKDRASTILKQLLTYKAAHYPFHNGLVATAVLVRRHQDEHVKALMEAWWNEIDGNSCRDQISFNYAAWKTNFSFKMLPMNIYSNDYFIIRNHDQNAIYSDKRTNMLASFVLRLVKLRNAAKQLIV